MIYHERKSAISQPEIDQLLSGVSDPETFSRLIELVYGELRHIARCLFRGERRNHTLQPTDLVHETFINLSGKSRKQYKNRAEFFAFTTYLMREILVDYARKHRSLKRGGNSLRVPFDELRLIGWEACDYTVIDDLLTRLEKSNRELAAIAELHIFAGLTFREIAALSGAGESTVRKRWGSAQTLLQDLLREGAA